jgi:hypothetical protein
MQHFEAFHTGMQVGHGLDVTCRALQLILNRTVTLQLLLFGSLTDPLLRAQF